MKIFGIFWAIFSLGILVFIFWLATWYAQYDDAWTNPIYLYIIGIIGFLMFFNIAIIKKNKIIFISPLFLLFKYNKFPLIKVNKIAFTKFYGTTSFSVGIKIFDKNDLVRLETTIHWFDFEIEKLIKVLKSTDIEIIKNY